jgi:hypothetical protein
MANEDTSSADSEALKEFYDHVHKISTIIRDYERTLKELVKDGEHKIQPLLLYPESKLPVSRDVIEGALGSAWVTTEHLKMDDYFGISKNTLEGLSLTLRVPNKTGEGIANRSAHIPA